MAEKDTSIVRKSEDESSKNTNPFSSFFSKFTQVINLPLPPKKDVVKLETEKKAVVRGDEVVEFSKSAKVTYPDGRKTTVSSLKLESEGAEQETNPAVLWQVYVIGGFFILKWAWGRWNEYQARKKPPSDDQTNDEGN